MFIVWWLFCRCAGTPWGTLPLLEVDGNVIGQSITIARFIAKEGGQYLVLPTLPEWAGDSRNSSQSLARGCLSPGIQMSGIPIN